MMSGPGAKISMHKPGLKGSFPISCKHTQTKHVPIAQKPYAARLTKERRSH